MICLGVDIGGTGCKCAAFDERGVQHALSYAEYTLAAGTSNLPPDMLYRAVLWAASAEAELHKWFSTNYNVEVHAYVKNGKYCVVNNTYEPQDTTVYVGDGSGFDLHLEPNEIKWYQI